MNAFMKICFFGIAIFLVFGYWQSRLAIEYSNKPPNIKHEIRLKSEFDCSAYHESRNHFYEIDGRTYPPYVPLHLNKSINFDCLNSLKKVKKILIWTPFWTPDRYDYPLGDKEPFIQANCPVYNCEIFSDKMRLQEADYVYVNLNMEVGSLPRSETRPKHQRWIAAAYESPLLSSDFSSYNGYFNFSSTYSLKSHFPGFFDTKAKFYWEESDDFDVDHRDFSANKTKFAVALISNCNGRNDRLKIIEEIRRHVDVTGYGACFENKRCDKFCRMKLSRDHKFFLAFENAVCDEYVTEKFFSAIQYDIIPVVYGGAEYTKFMPKSAFIDILDFKSIKALTDYLKYLDSNSTAYNEYFKWKKYVKRYKAPIEPSPFCDMCIKLNLETFEGIKPSIVTDLDKLHHKSQCRNAFFSNESDTVILSH